MPTLSITKSYANGSVLTETDLDNIRTDLTTFFNTTKIDSDNIQANGVQGSKLNSNVVDNSTLQYTSSQISIKDLGVTTAKLAANAVTRAKVATIDQIPAGCVQMFHTFNGAVSIPRGWMPLDGDVVNEANYNATHGAGAYSTDGVASSALLNKNLPNMASKFPIGAASTTQDGTVAITYTGNTSNQINIAHTHTGPSHQHRWMTTSGSNTQSWNASGVAGNIINNPGGTGIAFTSGGGAVGDREGGSGSYTELDGAAATSSSLSATQSITPHSCEFIYIMKVI